MNKLYGVFYGSISGFTWGLYTVGISLIMTFQIFNIDIPNKFFSILVIIFIHDIFSIFWLFFKLFLSKKLKKAIKIVLSKDFFLLLISSLLLILGTVLIVFSSNDLGEYKNG